MRGVCQSLPFDMFAWTARRRSKGRIVVGGGFRRALGRVLLAVAAFGLLLPAAPAGAQNLNESWSLDTHASGFMHDGVRYRLAVSAYESENSEFVQVTISKRKNPKGVRWAEQSHTYSFSELSDVFSHADNLSSAKILTGGQLGDYGKISLTFAKNGEAERSCDGHVRTRPGTLEGTLELRTGGNRFGVIREVPVKAALTYSDGQCGDEQSSNPCPPAGFGLSAFTGDSDAFMFAEKSKGDDHATIGMFWGEKLDEPTQNLHHNVFAQVPASNVDIDDNLGSATVRGAPKTWLSGESTFSSNGRAETYDPSECGKGREYVYSSRPGTLNGTLRANSWFGPDLKADEMLATASNTVVRDR